LVAAPEDSYSLLLDGDEPVSFVARPSIPVYFLFDSRKASELLTLTLGVPFDSQDPEMSLVSMYVLDCAAKTVGQALVASAVSNMKDKVRLFLPKELQASNDRPSPENYRYQGFSNSRSQLVALVMDSLGGARPIPAFFKPFSPQAAVNPGSHCYYRIAVISHRLQPVTLNIRGFESHKGIPITLGQPLEGAAQGEQQFLYQVDADNQDHPPSDMVLSLEVCSGKTSLRTSPKGPTQAADVPGTLGGLADAHPTLSFDGAVPPLRASLASNRWMEVAAQDGKTGTYILTVEDPESRLWLAPRPSAALRVTHEGGADGKSLTLEWSRAKMFGAGQPVEGSGIDSDPLVHYEVFYLKVDQTQGNLSSPCGLYYEWHRRSSYSNPMKRMITHGSPLATITDLEPNEHYVFNVVGRSLRKDLSVAYEPYNFFTFSSVFHASSLIGSYSTSSDGSRFWADFLPPFIVVLGCGLLVYFRPCCKGDLGLGSVDLELPTRSAREYVPMERSFGSYAPPSMVGLGSG